MKTKITKRLLLATLSCICVFAMMFTFAYVNVGAKAKAEDQTLYTQNFDSLSTQLTENEIYSNTYFAGANRSLVQSTGVYIKAPYQFYDNGCQNGAVYTDSNRFVSSTDVGKEYTLALKVKPYGDFTNMIIGIAGADTTKYNSVIILNADGTSEAQNYASESAFVTLNTAKCDNGWFDVNATLKGTGGYIMLTFYMNVEGSRYEEINAAKATGFCLESLSVKQGETSVYEMTLAAGLVGNDALFAQCGLAGFDAAAATYKDGISGTTLKAVYDFWSTADGGWQKEGVYINENALNLTLEEGKTYQIDFSVRLFGKVSQAIGIFSQVGADTDSQIIFKSDKTYTVVEYKETKMFENTQVTLDGDVFKVSAQVKGLGKPFKLMFNMLSSDADSANANKDTGLYLDDICIKSLVKDEPVVEDPTVGEYKVLLTRNFNNDSLDIEGGNAMFAANGFAGVSGGILNIKEDGFNGDRCLNAVYDFWSTADGGWQKDFLYLNSGALGNTEDGKIYKWDMQVKPFGHIDCVYIGFNHQYPSDARDYVVLKNGQVTIEQNGNEIIKAQLNSYTDGVYDITVYLYGNGGYTFNFFNIHSSDADSANADRNTGIMLDNYSISVMREAVADGFNVTERLYNTFSAKDFSVNCTFTEITELKVGEQTLSTENYSFANGKLTVKAAYLKTLTNGDYTFTATNQKGQEGSFILHAEYIPMGLVYENDFSNMPELNGTQDAKDNFFRNSWMDPLSHNVYTDGTDSERAIKFVADTVSEENISMFQTNPNEGRLHYLTKDKWHVVSADFKPIDASVLTIRVLSHGATDVELFTLEIDITTGERLSGTKSDWLCYDVTAKEGGWYNVSVTFKFTQEEGAATSYAYVVFYAAKPLETTVWYMDNIRVESEVYPELKSSESRFDLASSTRPYAIIDLKTFEITSVTEGENVLSLNTDYTIDVTPTGSYKLNLTQAFCEKYALNDEKVITVATSKGVNLTFNMQIVDSKPILASSTDCDLALEEDVKLTADFKGYEISLINLNEKELLGTEFSLNTQGEFVLKYSYLKTFAVGSYSFEIVSTSGASVTLMVNISNSTPEFDGTAVYDKVEGQDYSVNVNLFGKELVAVELDGKALTEQEYTYAEGVLTIKAAVLSAKDAGKYDLTVTTTTATGTLNVQVKDVPPSIEGDYEVKKGEVLVLTVNLNGKEIVEIKVGEFTLNLTDYTYENGTLTLNADLLSELAAGQQTITLTTSGGSVEKTFTLTEKTITPSSDEESCLSNLNGNTIILVVLAIAAIYVLNKKAAKRA